MSPTYDGNGNRRNPENDPTVGGSSVKAKSVSGVKRSGPKSKPKAGEGKTLAFGKPDLRPVSPLCNVCQSAYRDQIEKFITYGMSQADVIRYMGEVGEKLSVRSMSGHVKNHMTMNDSVTRRLIEKQAEKQFENIEQIADHLLTNRAMLEVMRQKAFNAIVDDSVSIEPETALKIIDKISADDAKHHQERVDEMVFEMNVLMSTLKQIVPEGMWDKITEQFRTNLEIERAKRKQLGRGAP